MIKKINNLNEGVNWWDLYAKTILQQASNKAIANGCEEELVKNIVSNANIHMSTVEDKYLLVNGGEIVCIVPKNSNFNDLVINSINSIANWITIKLNKNDLNESLNVEGNKTPKNALLKIDFNGYYSEKSKKFDGGLYPMLEYIKNNKLKNVIIRLDYDKKNTTSWEEVDLYCNELSIKKLNYTINDTYPKYTAYIECNPKYVRFLVKLLIQMASLGNGGHSYGILINDKQFNFDGDGADHISSINDVKINNNVYSDINKQIDIYNKALTNDKNMNENKKQIKLTESEFKQFVSESVKSVINEISKSGLKRKWINKIYKVITPLTSSIYSDEAWQNVNNVFETMENVLNNEGELNVWCENGGYRKQKGESMPSYKVYNFKIKFINEIEIGGELTCHAAGSMQDPFNRYDISVVMW